MKVTLDPDLDPTKFMLITPTCILSDLKPPLNAKLIHLHCKCNVLIFIISSCFFPGMSQLHLCPFLPEYP